MIARKAATAALGTVFARAIALIGTGAPAFAAAPAISDPSILAQPPIGIERSIREEPSVQFRPNLEMRFLNRSRTGLTVHYHFRLTNVGIDRADKVKIRTRTWQRSYGGDDYTFDDHQSMLHTLAAGKSFDITLDCTPKPGFVCDAAVTDAMVDDELATYNNVGISQ
jgi:hypothetical protein